MTLRGWPEFLAGLLIVLTVFGDVFSTVLVPRASHRGVRFGPLLGRGLAMPWRRLARLLPTPRLRQDFRGALAPFILVLALASWVAALAFGFALMLHAQPQNVSIDRFGFDEALFQSTLALSTLGMIHADINGWARAVVAVAGVAGFSIVSLVVAFLLSIQGALHRREVLVMTLVARAGRPPTALRLLEALATAEDRALSELFVRWELWTADVMQSHLSYPILCRFRSLDENAEWLACWATVLDAAALIASAAPADYPHSCREAGFLLETARRAVHELARLLHVRDAQPPLDRDQLRLVGDDLSRLGLGPNDGANDPVARGFDERRQLYAPRLAAIADALDIEWGDTLFAPLRR